VTTRALHAASRPILISDKALDGQHPNDQDRNPVGVWISFLNMSLVTRFATTKPKTARSGRSGSVANNG
jgi:hypothetical protein